MERERMSFGLGEHHPQNVQDNRLKLLDSYLVSEGLITMPQGSACLNSISPWPGRSGAGKRPYRQKSKNTVPGPPLPLAWIGRSRGRADQGAGRRPYRQKEGAQSLVHPFLWHELGGPGGGRIRAGKKGPTDKKNRNTVPGPPSPWSTQPLMQTKQTWRSAPDSPSPSSNQPLNPPRP
eukprot:1145918-Pelagomonas_calceolata.AAC.3